MTEHDLTPEHEAEVRRLLADARHNEPTPDVVVARLDRVLAGLADEPARSAHVVRLADRRRRAATILVAAAASVAAVIGIGQVLSTPGGEDDASSAADSAEAGPEGDAAPGPQSGDDASGARANALGDRDKPLALKSERFAVDAEALKSLAAPGLVGENHEDGRAPEESLSGSLNRVKDRTVCEPGGWGRGSYVAVLYDGAEGWVVLRQPRGDTQIVDLFLCGSEVAVRSVTLPHP